MHHIYCISGLGADHRIFQKLKIENACLHFINWQMPAEEDTMRSYAIKLASQVRHREIVLVGVSFGGMLATELTNHYAEQVDPATIILKTILISSCKSEREFPGMMQAAGRLGLYKAVPYNLVLRSSFLNRFVFDLKSKEEELYLKRMMLQENNVLFIRRSVAIILQWQNAQRCEVVHVHGTTDKLLTPKNVQADHWIEGGGHFMVWNKAGEVSRVINKVLEGFER